MTPADVDDAIVLHTGRQAAALEQLTGILSQTTATALSAAWDRGHAQGLRDAEQYFGDRERGHSALGTIALVLLLILVVRAVTRDEDGAE